MDVTYMGSAHQDALVFPCPQYRRWLAPNVNSLLQQMLQSEVTQVLHLQGTAQYPQPQTISIRTIYSEIENHPV